MVWVVFCELKVTNVVTFYTKYSQQIPPQRWAMGCLLSLEWRHNGRDRVSNHQPHDCLLNRLFRHRSKKTSKLRLTGLCVGNSPGTGEFPAQMASYAENVSIWWRHHDEFWIWGSVQYKNAMLLVYKFPLQIQDLLTFLSLLWEHFYLERWSLYWIVALIYIQCLYWCCGTVCHAMLHWSALLWEPPAYSAKHC